MDFEKDLRAVETNVPGLVVFDLPVTFSMKALIGGYKFPYRWNREHTARVALCLDISGSMSALPFGIAEPLSSCQPRSRARESAPR